MNKKMNTKLMSIFTRAPLHVGAGSSVGAVDQPVVRERHTGYPVIPGSSLKGVLADLWNDEKGEKFVRSEEGVKLFGSDDQKDPSAGKLLIGEGKLLAFPVRSAKGCWAWLTSPLALERFARDKRMPLDVPSVAENAVLASASLRLSDKVILEEFPLVVSGEVPPAIVDAFKELLDENLWKDNVAGHLVVVSDEMFAYFVKNACEIANHNRIDDKTGVVADGALFSQENVPSETLFYAVFSARKGDEDAFAQLKAKVAEENNLLQIGADMTTGLGWCTVALKEVK